MKFTKQILRPGKYAVRSADGRRSRVEEISPDRLRRIVESFKAMRANGLRIPAPWRHDKSLPLTEDVKDSRDNAGFWEDSWIGTDGAWYGRLDVPLPADAEKVGATVTEVSPYILPDWEDGKQHKYIEPPVHIALIQHPVSPGQSNFEPVAESAQPAMALALSMFTEGAVLMADEPTTASVATAEPETTQTTEPPAKATAPSIQDVLTALKSVGLELPEDTTPENLAERIVTGAKAIAGKKKEEAGTSEPGNESETKEHPVPVAMGGEIMSISKTVSEDKKTLSFQSEQDCERFQQQADKSLEFAGNLLRERYTGRINNLLRTGRITPAMVDEQLKPLIEGFELSFGADGKAIPTQLDIVLSVLESQPANKVGMAGDVTGSKSKKNPLTGIAFGVEEPMPYDYVSGGEVSPERADEIVKLQFAASGRTTKQ